LGLFTKGIIESLVLKDKASKVEWAGSLETIEDLRNAGLAVDDFDVEDASLWK
jgi:hypothetical protein